MEEIRCELLEIKRSALYLFNLAVVFQFLETALCDDCLRNINNVVVVIGDKEEAIVN